MGTKKQQIEDASALFPEWTSAQIAAHAGASVSWTQRNRVGHLRKPPVVASQLPLMPPHLAETTYPEGQAESRVVHMRDLLQSLPNGDSREFSLGQLRACGENHQHHNFYKRFAETPLINEKWNRDPVLRNWGVERVTDAEAGENLHDMARIVGRFVRKEPGEPVVRQVEDAPVPPERVIEVVVNPREAGLLNIHLSGDYTEHRVLNLAQRIPMLDNLLAHYEPAEKVEVYATNRADGFGVLRTRGGGTWLVSIEIKGAKRAVGEDQLRDQVVRFRERHDPSALGVIPVLIRGVGHDRSDVYNLTEFKPVRFDEPWDGALHRCPRGVQVHVAWPGL